MDRKLVLMTTCGAVIILFFVIFEFMSWTDPAIEFLDRVPLLKSLAEQSEKGDPAANFEDIQFAESDLPAVIDYICAKRDNSAYYSLFILREKHPAAYKKLPGEVKAAVICSALEKQRYVDDFGHLTPYESYDKDVAKALIEVGRPAIGFLRPLLKNRQVAILSGSRSPILSTTYSYRRADFAYRYIFLILGRVPTFDPDPATRDMKIDELIAELESKGE